MLNLPVSLLTTAAISLLLATSGTAQGGQQQSVGFGQIKRSFNITQLVGTHPGLQKDGRIRGVAAHPNRLLYVSGRNGGASSDHRVYIVDPATTTVLGWFSIPEPGQSTSWGAMDMGTDLAGNIIAGTVNGVVAFDIAGNQVRQIVGNAGPITMPLDANGDSIIGNQNGALDQIDVGGTREFEAVAFDPSGDGGQGSVFVAQGLDAGDFLELRISDASVIRTFAPLPDANGLAIDPISGQLWINASFDNTPGDVIVEMDLNGSVDADMNGVWDLLETGITLPKLRNDGTGNLGRTYGGIDFMANGDPGSPFFGTSAWDMVQISQDNEGSSGDDLLGFTRVHLFPGVHGLLGGPELRGSSGTNPIANLSPILYTAQGTLNWGVANNGRPNSLTPAAIVLNFGADARIDGITTFPNGMVFPELVAISSLSSPAATVGELIQNTAVDITTSVTLPASFPVNTGDIIRMQAIYFEPASPFLGGLAASNELWFVGNGINEILVEMEAPNALSVNLLNPTFRVTELTGDPTKSITQIIWSVGINSQLPGDNWFDVDEFGMFDFFGAGNGMAYGCTGTYRNGSDVASGLIYAGTDIINWPTSNLPCADALRALDMMGNPIDPKSGFKGSDSAGGGLRRPRIVEFNFPPGKFAGMTFGFDADLDGNLNTASLRDWAGTWVRIERADGVTFEGLLFADSDPNHPDRALIGF